MNHGGRAYEVDRHGVVYEARWLRMGRVRDAQTVAAVHAFARIPDPEPPAEAAPEDAAPLPPNKE